MAQLQDNLARLTLTLAPEQVKLLDDASRIEPGFPESFFAREMVRTFAYGGLRQSLLV